MDAENVNFIISPFKFSKTNRSLKVMQIFVNAAPETEITCFLLLFINVMVMDVAFIGASEGKQ